MEIIKISAIAILPLIGFMALGYLLKKRNYMSDSEARRLSTIAFKYFLSIYSAESIYKSDLHNEVEMKTLIFTGAVIVGMFALMCLIVPRFEKDKTRIPVVIQGIYKTNYAVLALPLVESICGKGNAGMAAVLLIIVVPFNNMLSAFLFEKYNGNNTSTFQVIFKAIKNPLVMGSLIGLALNLLKIEIPAWIMTGFISKLSALTTPISLIALGASFEFTHVKEYKKQLIWVSLGKLVFTPLIVLPLAVLIGIRGSSLAAIAAFSAGPTAVNSYPTAVAMGGDGDLANEIVVITSTLSMLTLFLTFCILGLTVGF